MELIDREPITDGYKEFIIVNTILIMQYGFLLIIKLKKSALENTIIQCLLALYDIFCLNSRQEKLFSFVTTGEQ